jgi:type 1 glutamine amidotransferase
MHNEIGDEYRQHLREFVENGGGVVSTHHAIVNYTSWPWWHQKVTGGKYFPKETGGHKASKFVEGTDIVTMPVEGVKHPVLQGVGPIVAHDEAYRDMWFAPGITVLMETDHPENDRPVVYVGPTEEFRSIYIQLGHSAETFHHAGYRRLVHNAILWAAGRGVR